jgi:DNA-binding NarL/FixJ family response regulator
MNNFGQTIRTVGRTKMRSETTETLVASVRIFLVDDHELLRAAIRSLLGEVETLAVVGEAGDRAQALARIEKEQPDIILLNADLKTGDGLEMLPDLLDICSSARVLVLTDSGDPTIHRKAMLLGAAGVLMKDKPPDLLMKAISRIHAGEAWFDRSTTATMLEELSPRNKTKLLDPDQLKIESITEREREVIKLVGEGLKNKQIAERLFISDITVHHHLTSVYSKLQVKDRLELLIYAYRNRLAELPR